MSISQKGVEQFRRRKWPLDAHITAHEGREQVVLPRQDGTELLRGALHQTVGTPRGLVQREAALVQQDVPLFAAAQRETVPHRRGLPRGGKDGRLQSLQQRAQGVMRHGASFLSCSPDRLLGGPAAGVHKTTIRPATVEGEEKNERRLLADPEVLPVLSHTGLCGQRRAWSSLRKSPPPLEHRRRCVHSTS